MKRLTEPPPSARAARRERAGERWTRRSGRRWRRVVADRFGTMAQFAQALQAPIQSVTSARSAPSAPTPNGRHAARPCDRDRRGAVAKRRKIPVAATALHGSASSSGSACCSPGGTLGGPRRPPKRRRGADRRAPVREPGRLVRRVLRRRRLRRGARQAHRAAAAPGDRARQLGAVRRLDPNTGARSRPTSASSIS